MFDYRKATKLLGEAIAALRGDLVGERLGLAGFPSVMARAFQAQALAYQGQFADGAVASDEAVALCERLGHPYSRAVAYWGAGTLHIVKGDLVRATALLERGLSICREWPLGFMEPLLAFSLGYAQTLSGRLSDGLSLLEQAVERIEGSGFVLARPLVLAHLAEAYALAGRTEAARSAAERALADARALRTPALEAPALTFLVATEAECDRPDVSTAEGHAADAIALATGLGMRPLIAHCHRHLARLYRRAGQDTEAHAHTGIAIRMYRELDMHHWLEKTEEATTLASRAAPVRGTSLVVP
jgi:tetratricopeptide (TPR) repeat protein